MKRRDFLRVTLVGGAAAAVAPLDLWGKGTGKSGFTLWQLPSQVDTIGNSFVFLTDKGRVVVMDGGMKRFSCGDSSPHSATKWKHGSRRIRTTTTSAR